MADILLSYEVSIHIFVQIITVSLLTLSFYFTIYILKNYTPNATTSKQYNLEKKSYLVVTIIQFFLIIKIILLPFFTYTLDQLSNIIPGAMCAAGVISANEYGEILLIFKIVIILSTMLWLVLNKEDYRTKGFKYFRKKLYFFLFIYILILIEIILELLYFTKLTTVNPVSCCSTLYNAKETQMFSFSTTELLILFYLTYVFLIISAFFKKKYLLSPLSLFFLYLSYLSISYFFSTYVYQLPSHKCPYCLLQYEYNYIGYLIYTSLLLATFYALSASLFRFHNNAYRHTIIWYTIFVLILSAYVIVYFLENKTFL